MRRYNARHEFVLAVRASSFANHAFVIVQLLFKEQGIIPTESRARKGGIHAILLIVTL
jgi:hypothetical protein